ncbi:carbonic anhydrase [Paludisphaera rhizosphaerae]|uniref:carbonic anhydrase n=1 Tax=Paludisphaera rhizosphaerae TaxID=2711216 RepID=UPI0013EAFA23|nr:carbonic anhydrase [Paludisphaera rhizosphaerae]
MDVIYRYDPYADPKPRPAADAKGAIRTLREGNDRFRSYIDLIQHGIEEGRNGNAQSVVVEAEPVRMRIARAVGGQPHTPYALVLGCSDARAPIEHIFDQSSNDLFVIRVAGNVLGTECLGSIDYAVRNLGSSLSVILVLGHTTCGAVSAAVDLYLAPHDYPALGLTHALRSIVDRVQIAVRGADKAISRVCGSAARNHPGYRDALIEASIYLNAALTAFDVHREVKLFDDESRIRIVFSVFDLSDLGVRALPGSRDEAATFGEVTGKPADLENLGDEIAKAVVAKGMLGPETQSALKV